MYLYNNTCKSITFLTCKKYGDHTEMQSGGQYLHNKGTQSANFKQKSYQLEKEKMM
jgi:hypothetical protein